MALWGTRTVVAPVNLIVAGNAILVIIVVIVIIVAIVVVISCNVAAMGGVRRAVLPLLLSL